MVQVPLAKGAWERKSRGPTFSLVVCGLTVGNECNYRKKKISVQHKILEGLLSWRVEKRKKRAMQCVPVYVCVSVCLSLYVCVCLYVPLCVCICISTCVCVCEYACVCMCISARVCMCVCLCLCVLCVLCCCVQHPTGTDIYPPQVGGRRGDFYKIFSKKS